MTMFGMPPDDPEGLMRGVDGTVGFGDQGDSLADSEDSSSEMLGDADESIASEAVRDPAPADDDI